MDKSFSIEIKYDDKLGQVLIAGSGMDSWMNLGLAIEGIGVLMAIERNERKFENSKTKGIDTREKLTDYVIEYIKRVANDYDNSSIAYLMPKFEKRDNEDD